jgi:GR25 family glycosyltransferase involved in LPS biosynthesis
MLKNPCFEVFHIDSGNVARNSSYAQTLDAVSFLPQLNSETQYLNTFAKVDEFKKANPDFKVNTIEDYCQIGETFPPNAGVIGLWASTYKAWLKFLESDYDTLIVFEDDIILSKNFYPILNNYMSELPANWDFFSPFVPDDSFFAYSPEWHDFGAENTCKSYQQWSTACYLVTRAGAEKALQDIKTQGITAPIDWYIFNFRMKAEENQARFDTYTVKPNRYKPVKLMQGAFEMSEIHNGSTELLHKENEWVG